LPSPLAARSRCSSSPAVHRPTLTLPSLVDCCFFTPPADGGGGLGASSAPPIQWTQPTPPQNASRGCGVAATATAIPALASGQFWPTPSPGACTYGATRGRGGRAGMPSFGAISIALHGTKVLMWGARGQFLPAAMVVMFVLGRWSRLA
jgi:hypothetical protein